MFTIKGLTNYHLSSKLHKCVKPIINLLWFLVNRNKKDFDILSESFSYLWENLKKAQGRVIFTGSNSHKRTRMHWRDVMYSKHYSKLMAYKQSKLCNMLFAKELRRRFADSGVRAFVVDPGLVKTGIGGKQTNGIIQAFWKLHSKRGVSPDYAAKTYVYLVNQDPEQDGLYFHACRPAVYDRRADNEQDAKRLFELSERLCGIRFDGRE